MTCPNCGHEWLRPTKQQPPHRMYRCYECGYVFRTVEQVVESAERQAFQAAMFNILKGNRATIGR